MTTINETKEQRQEIERCTRAFFAGLKVEDVYSIKELEEYNLPFAYSQAVEDVEEIEPIVESVAVVIEDVEELHTLDSLLQAQIDAIDIVDFFKFTEWYKAKYNRVPTRIDYIHEVNSILSNL